MIPFIGYQDRILFGIDQLITDTLCELEKTPTEESRYLVLGHTRFIRKPLLPYDIIEKILHSNAERLYGIEPIL